MSRSLTDGLRLLSVVQKGSRNDPIEDDSQACVFHNSVQDKKKVLSP